MGSILASALIAQASEIAQDETNVTWSTTQALEWLNDAQKALVSMRPDASVSVSSMLLVPGTKQMTSGRRLMGVSRNMGSDGATEGRAVRLVERGIKDDYNPSWHSDTATLVVKEYIYDARLPQQFWVWPPVSPASPVYIETIEATTPADLTAQSQAISINDIYAPPLVEWMCYRFFSRDAEEMPDAQRAASHFGNFFALMGEKIKVDMAVSPKVRAQLDE
jgi:hypothetical protein